MTIDTNQFWSLLTKSQLVPQSKIQTLFTELQSATNVGSAEDVARWLVGKKAVSNYQAQILLAGHNGPFNYGNYIVVDCYSKPTNSKSLSKDFSPDNPIGNVFRARHRTTNHPVILEFVSGSEAHDLDKWKRIEDVSERMSDIRHPNMLAVYESVALSRNRFIVREKPSGAALAEKLPRKARLPMEKACSILAQIAGATNSLHRTGVRHGSICPSTIFVAKNGLAQLTLPLQHDSNSDSNYPNEKDAEARFHYLAPESNAALASNKPVVPSTSADIYSLGCTLFRAIAGRVPFPGSSEKEVFLKQKKNDQPTDELAKYKLPKPLLELISQMLSLDPEKRPDDLTDLSSRLAKLAGDESKKPKPTRLASLAPYLQSVSKFKPGSETKVESVPEISTATESDGDGQSDLEAEHSKKISEERANKISAAAKAAARRKKGRWVLPAAIAASLLGLSGLIGLWAITYGNTRVEVPVAKETETTNEDVETEVIKEPEVNFAEMPEADRPILAQQIVDDSDELLWETPTVGAPVSLTGLPTAPKIIFVFRPSDIAENNEGQLVLQSLAPDFSLLIKQMTNRCGLELTDIEQLIMSLHTTTDFDYEPFFVVKTKQPIEQDRLMQLWNLPEVQMTESGQKYFVGESDTAYYLLYDGAIAQTEPVNADGDSSDSAESDQDATAEDNSTTQENSTAQSNSISRFAFGSNELITEVAGNAGLNLLAGPLKKMSNWIDRDRHLNILYLRPALFNDEGQKLMGSRLQSVNRELSIMMPDDVRGGLISMHLDGGTYIEMMFDRNVDMKPNDLQDVLTGLFGEQRDRLTQFVGTIPPSPYWDKVRLRYDNMLSDFYRNLRWRVEHGEVTANCWLPPMAAHNLFAASELVVSFSSGSAGVATAAATPTGPQTLEELLNTKRDLNIANPPDLNLLVADIEQEINDDFRGLPFEFHIRLLGSDLQKDGITKNQRPGELNLVQTSIADILTSICVGANPSKEISGPSDPECKLIWVVAEDPDSPGNQAVLITTRAAAELKSYALPDVFKTE